MSTPQIKTLEMYSESFGIPEMYVFLIDKRLEVESSFGFS